MKKAAVTSVRWAGCLCLAGAIVGVGLVQETLALRPFISATDAEIVEPGNLELEMGVSLSRNTRADANEITWDLPGAVLNIGLSRNFELDVGTGIELVRTNREDGGRTTLGSAAETSLTSKIRFFEGKEAVPSIATELTLLFPSQRRELLPSGSRDLAFTGVLIATGEIASLKYHLNAGGGISKSLKNSADVVGSILWAAAGELPLFHRLSAVAEYRGTAAEASFPDMTLLGGLVWESPWGVRFDLAGFGGLTRGSDNWGITVGFTYAFRALPWIGGAEKSPPSNATLTARGPIRASDALRR